jgi:hypothetical protein
MRRITVFGPAAPAGGDYVPGATRNCVAAASSLPGNAVRFFIRNAAVVAVVAVGIRSGDAVAAGDLRVELA